MKMNISPNYSEEKLNNPCIDDLIDVFEDRIKNWLLEPAKKLIGVPIDRVPAFCLLLTYFEGILIFIKGQDSKDKSAHFFREAFIDVFKSSGLKEAILGRIADVLYKEGRCGFFHDGMFRAKLLFKELKNKDMLVTVPKVNRKPDEEGKIQSIVIDPCKFYAVVERHFNSFINQLRDESNISLRDSFKEACELKWNLSSDGIAIGMDYDEFIKT